MLKIIIRISTLLGALNGLGKVERFVRVTLRVEFDAHAGEIGYSLFKIQVKFFELF